MLGVAGRRRRFEELSLPRFAAWGAFGGLLLSLVPAALAAVGLVHGAGSDLGLWRATAVMAGPLILLSSASAAGSLALARRARERDALPAGSDLGTAELAEGETKRLAGGGR